MTDFDNQSIPPLDSEWLERFRTSIKEADGLVMCIDYDGTLAPIVEDPRDASMVSGNRQRLETLAKNPDITVAIVSGRSLWDLRQRVQITQIWYAGNHGLEVDDGNGREIMPEGRRAEPGLETALESLRETLSEVPNCYIEDKGLTATVHYRQVPESDVPTVVESVESVVETTTDLRCCQGKEIIEIRPDVSRGKDRVVDRLRSDQPEALLFFIGDDRSDEDGFSAIDGDGYGILVGDRVDSAASVRVANPKDVTRLLDWIADQKC